VTIFVTEHLNPYTSYTRITASIKYIAVHCFG